MGGGVRELLKWRNVKNALHLMLRFVLYHFCFVNRYRHEDVYLVVSFPPDLTVVFFLFFCIQAVELIM